jgi:hypothetical protein
MSFTYEDKQIDSQYIDKIWHTRTTSKGVYTANLDGNWDIIITKSQYFTNVSVNGIGKEAVQVPYIEGIESIGIALKPGVFLRNHRGKDIADSQHVLVEGNVSYVEIDGQQFEIPNFESAEEFVGLLAASGILLVDTVVSAFLEQDVSGASKRTVRRHVSQVTGLSPNFLSQIERAKYAAKLLQKGVPIAKVAIDAGYSDQAHMTKSVKKIMGSTPAQLSSKSPQ